MDESFVVNAKVIGQEYNDGLECNDDGAGAMVKCWILRVDDEEHQVAQALKVVHVTVALGEHPKQYDEMDFL